MSVRLRNQTESLAENKDINVFTIHKGVLKFKTRYE